MTPERQPIVCPLLLALLLGQGIHIALYVALIWGYSVCSQFLGNKEVYEDFAVLADGTPVVITRAHNNANFDQSGRTLEGEAVPVERLDKTHRVGNLPGLKRPRQYLPIGRVDWSNRMVPFRDNSSHPPKIWHFIHTGRKEGQGYFVGFDGRTSLRVGYIGRNGPSPTKPSPEECFAVDGRQLTHSGQLVPSYVQFAAFGMTGLPSSTWSEGGLSPMTAYLACGGELLEVDLGEQKVRVVSEFDEPFSIGWGGRAFPPYEAPDLSEGSWCREHLVIRTHKEMTLLDPCSDAQKVFQIPAEARENQLSFYEFADGTVMLHVFRPTVFRSTEGNILPLDLYWLDDTGKVVRDAHLELAARGGPPMDTRLTRAGIGLTMPVPVAWTVASFVAMPLSYIYGDKKPGYWAALTRSLGAYWPALLVNLAIAGVTVWWCIKRQQRYAAEWTRTWVVFVALFGLPTFLGYLLHRRWPVRVECPACHQPAPRDRLSCSACDADFPEPAAEGIEVFA